MGGACRNGERFRSSGDLEAAETPGGGFGGCAAHSYGSWINGTGTCIEHGQAPRATSTRERNGGLV